MSKRYEILCLGVDPAGLGVGIRPLVPGVGLEFAVAMDRGSLRQAFVKPYRWDLILCRSSAFYDLAVDQLLRELAGKIDASLILVRPPESALSPAEAARRGAADLVQHGDREHLEAVMVRELTTTQLRKTLRKWRNDDAAAGQPSAPPDPQAVVPSFAVGSSLLDNDNDDGGAAASPAPPAETAEEGALDDKQVKLLIEAGGLTLEYQPIVQLAQDGSQQAAMFEALLRLRGEDGQLLAPARFFPVATKYQWLGKLDLWVYRRALPILEKIQGAGTPETLLFANLSTESLESPKVMEAILGTITEARIECGSLIVELSIDALTRAPAAVAQFQQALKRQGHKLLLQNLQAGDLKTLRQHLELIDYVKLGPHIIHGLETREMDRLALQEIIRAVKDRGVIVIALAVESADMLPALYASGVDFIQGHFVSKPLGDMAYPDAVSVDPQRLAMT